MSGPADPVGQAVDNPADTLLEERALNRALEQLPPVSVPEGLAGRIIATVSQLSQFPAEQEAPEPVADVAAPALTPPWRRYAVPVGLGGLTAIAASLAAVFLASAQGWQAPGAGVPEGVPTVAVAPAPAAAPSLAAVVPEPAPALPVAVPFPARRTPAVTPVVALGKAEESAAAGDAPALPASAAVLAENAANPEASEPPIPQLSPAEAAEVERRAARRAARDEGPLPGATAAPSLGFRPVSATQR